MTKCAFMLASEGAWPVSAMCSALGVTRQGYYAWKSRPPSPHAARDAELSALVEDVYAEGRGHYGAPRVFEVQRRRGVLTSRKCVARIMREKSLVGTSRGCARRPKGQPKTSAERPDAPDLVRRDFSAPGPNEAWSADITYVRTRQGWLYLAAIMDIWSRMVVGWSMGPRIDAELADDALRMAVERRHPPAGTVHHSDHGPQYTSLLLGKTMERYGIRPSMGSVASPWDNAVTKSPMGCIKSECVHARTFASRKEGALEIFEYIECFYNRVRAHSTLGYLSPVGYERASSPQGACSWE